MNLFLASHPRRRIDRTYEELAAAVRNGAVGAVRSVHAVFRDHPVPSIEFLKQGGDIFHDLAPHDVDFVCFSLGLGEPSEVRLCAMRYGRDWSESEEYKSTCSIDYSCSLVDAQARSCPLECSAKFHAIVRFCPESAFSHVCIVRRNACAGPPYPLGY